MFLSSPRTPGRLLAAGLNLTAGVALAATLPMGSARAAELDGIDTGAVADYSCSAGTVYVEPFSMTPLDGSWPIWARAQVYDAQAGWLTSDWIQADGITDLTFSVTAPAGSATVTYAHAADDGTWHYASEEVPITEDLDNYPPFC